MPVTKYLPLGFSDYWLSSTAITASAMLLRNDVTDIPETVTQASDLYSLEISSGGGYTAGATGTSMPSLNRVQDAGTGVAEFHAGSNLWQSSATLTISSFRWVVAMAYGNVPLAAWNLGADTVLSGVPLTLQMTESPYVSGIYPILRFKRNTT